MNRFVLGVFAGIALLIAMSVGGLYYLSEKTSALQEEKEVIAASQWFKWQSINCPNSNKSWLLTGRAESKGQTWVGGQILLFAA